MHRASASNFPQWRAAARHLIAAAVAPGLVGWNCAGSATSADTLPFLPNAPRTQPRISAALLDLLESLAMYRDPGRWELMYRLAWRSAENRRLLEDAADPDVHRATLMDRAVKRDLHKMHAFVRFREVADALGANAPGANAFGASAYFAWFEPEHEILARAALFFKRRFANMNWSIATPDGAMVWQDHQLRMVAAPPVADRPRHDPCEDLWRTYYRNICNVARINTDAMRREMPQRYWKHLPEAAEIGALARDGAARLAAAQRESPGPGLVPGHISMAALPSARAEEGPQSCRRCDLWRRATQAVEGEGDRQAKLMLVGEQPGDAEDLRGSPFVGPAGKVLEAALAATGLRRSQLFITNAVKHFKWEPRGKRRLHKKPGTAEIEACNLWLDREIQAVKPAVIVALGGTALKALTGANLTIDTARGRELRHGSGALIVPTYHPSAVLRADGARALELTLKLEDDLRLAARRATLKI